MGKGFQCAYQFFDRTVNKLIGWECSVSCILGNHRHQRGVENQRPLVSTPDEQMRLLRTEKVGSLLAKGQEQVTWGHSDCKALWI